LGEALRVAAGLANPGRQFEFGENRVTEALPATLYLVSDGKFLDPQGFSLGNLKAVYLPIGSESAGNIGITSFAVQRAEGETTRSQAFARIENHSDEDSKVRVTLLHDGRVIDADEIDTKAGQGTGVAFQLGDTQSGTLEARISPGGSLTNDDRAWTVVTPPRQGKVLLVTSGNDALEFALETPRAKELADVTIEKPSVLETKEYAQQAANSAYDLVIYDDCQPTEMPQANTLFIGKLPPLAVWGHDPKTPPGEIVAPQVIDVEAAHPLMQLIDLGNVLFGKALQVKVPAGGTKLIDTNEGVLFAVAPREGFEDAVLASPLVAVDEKGQRYSNTTWILRLSFPVFVLNTLEYLAGNGQAAQAGSIAPGRLMSLRSTSDAKRLTVSSPSGKSEQLSRTKGGTFNFANTDELGVYKVEENNKQTQAFAVNLFDSAESDIRTRPEVKIGYTDVKGEATTEGTRRELWRLLLLTAFLVLLGEWYIYNRRVYI
jgi:hypothetical protein